MNNAPEEEDWDKATPADLSKTKRKKPTELDPVKKIQNAGTDRLPPNSPECEQGVLGCVLLSPSSVMPEVIEKITQTGEEFYDLRHATIWGAMVEMYDANKSIDVITLQQYLKDNDMLDQVGGIQYLSSLPDAVPSAANLSYYLEFVIDKWRLRNFIRICTDAVVRVYDFEGDVDELLDQVGVDVLKVTEERETVGLKPIKQLVQTAISQIEDNAARQQLVTGISSGFSDLDRLTRGFQPSEMIVIAARPSMGKTSLAMNFAEAAALDQKLPVGVFSLEMSAEALVQRMICSRARVNLRNVSEGFIQQTDFPKLTAAATEIMNSPIYIDDTASLTLLQFRAKVRRMVQQFGVKIVFGDYLQLFRTGGRRENRQQEVSDISGGIKALAKELKIPVVILSQLNREMERDGTKRKPRLSDIRESGAVEQDADVIGFLYKPAVTDEDEGQIYTDASPVNLAIAKQRNGPTGEVALTFFKSITRFESAAKISDEDVPDFQATLFND